MAVVAPAKISAERKSSLQAFWAFTLLYAFLGCGLIVAVTPFVKSTILKRHLAAAGGHVRAQREARAAVMLDHIMPALTPYRDLLARALRMSAGVNAAVGKHAGALDAAEDLYLLLSGASVGVSRRFAALPGLGPLEGPANRLYNRLTARRVPRDPWIGYRDLARRYQDDRFGAGMRGLAEHLRRIRPDHPLDIPADSPLPLAARPVRGPSPAVAAGTPERTGERREHPAGPVRANGAVEAQWALTGPDEGAVAYNARRQSLRELPAGVIIEVLEHTAWEAEPMIRGNVFHLNRWVTNIYFRAAHVRVFPGSAHAVSERERDLQLRRMRLLDLISAEERRAAAAPVRMRVDPSAAATPPASGARRELRALRERAARLQREMEAAEGSRRAELINELQRMRYDEYRLRRAAAGAVESLESREPARAAETAPEESPRLRRLRRELEEAENALRRLAS